MDSISPKSRRWVCLRGLVRESRHWGDFPARLCAEVKGSLSSPLLLDLPGVGHEAGRRVPSTVSGFVDVLRPRLFPSRRPDTRDCLLAVSLGGMVALDWLARFPDDFECAVVINTSTADLSSPFARFHPRHIPAILRAAWRGGIERERILLDITTNDPALDRDAVARRHATYAEERPIGVGVFAAQLLAASRCRTPRRVEVPLLVLASKADRLVDVRCSMRLAEQLGCEISLHESAGHDLPLDDPDWVIAAVRRFVSGAMMPAEQRGS
ncbi:MAG: alpha/beta fold hydrolase [Myxococcota bacterium]